jgi:hypothetical protein
MSENETLTATFVPNPFVTRSGGYSGLISGADTGLLTLSVNSTGGFSGRITLDGKGYTVRGKFGLDGSATVSIARAHTTPLLLTLNLDVTGATGISGSVTDGTNSSTFTADASYNTADGKYASAGQYTVSLPPNPQSTDSTLPKGNGYAVMTVNAAGKARVSGALGDGTAFSVSGTVSQDNTLPVYVALYHGHGSLSGVLTIRDTGVSDVDGLLHWSKPAIPAAHVHPDPIEADTAAVGSQYARPAHGSTVVKVSASVDNTELYLGDGNLNQPVVETATLGTNNAIVVATPELAKLHASVDPATGRFTGSFVHPITHEVTSFRGVVFQ